jgi:hypothetical protein
MKNAIKVVADVLKKERQRYRNAKSDLDEKESMEWRREMRSLRVTLELLKEEDGRMFAGEILSILRR